MTHPSGADQGLEDGSALADAAISYCPDDAVVIVTVTDRVDLRFARTEVTTNGSASAWDVTVVAMPEVTGGRGVASSSSTDVWVATPQGPQLNATSLRQLVDRAFASARQTPPAPDAMPLLTADDFDITDAAEWSTPHQPLNLSHLTPVIDQLADVFRRARHDRIALFGYTEMLRQTTWVVTTTGRRRRGVEQHGRFEMTARPAGEPRSTWWGLSTNDLHSVDVHQGYACAVTALAHQRRQRHLQPGKHPVILTPSAAGDLMVDLWWSATAADAVEGRSVFSSAAGGTRISEQLAPASINLISDPRHPLVPASDLLAVASSSPAASVFDNGAVIPPTSWLERGRLNALMCSRELAARHSLPFSPSADTLAMEVTGAQGDLSDLIARTEHAVLVTCLWYNRLVDPQQLLITGLTRDGVYEVRDGEIIAALGNFRFLESPVNMLSRITDATTTSRTLPREMGDYAARVAMPALVVDGFDLNSASEAL